MEVCAVGESVERCGPGRAERGWGAEVTGKRSLRRANRQISWSRRAGERSPRV